MKPLHAGADSWGLSPEVCGSICMILQKYPEISRVLIYGSRAKGTYRSGSDVDLMIVAPTLSSRRLLKIASQIDDLMIPHRVDVALWHQVDNPALREHVEHFGQDFYCRRG